MGIFERVMQEHDPAAHSLALTARPDQEQRVTGR